MLGILPGTDRVLTDALTTSISATRWESTCIWRPDRLGDACIHRPVLRIPRRCLASRDLPAHQHVDNAARKQVFGEFQYPTSPLTIANTDQRLEDALNAIWVAGPGAPGPGVVLSGGEPMTREQAEAIMIDLTRRSTPAEGGFCTFQAVVDGGACPWQLDCHNCEKFVMSGADLLYWHRKREQWRMLSAYELKCIAAYV